MASTLTVPAIALTRIGQSLPAGASGAFCIAFSGGMDSTVLLHSMALIVREYPQYRLRALHIDHQLQAASASWSQTCKQACAQLGVAYFSVKVTLDPHFPEGVEAEARRARYETFRHQLLAGETLLTAHHADDQIETVLLALVRGSGVGGLAAMPEIRPFGAGFHLRPLLECTRAQLLNWAQEQQLHWIDDPSNDLPRFDRNYLRSAVLPVLRQRWPSVAKSVSRSAAHVGEARELLESLAEVDMQQAAVGRCLDVRVLQAFATIRRRNLLRFWLGRCGARMPNTRKLIALEHDVLHAANDRMPGTHWDDVEVRRHGDLLYCETAKVQIEEETNLAWNGSHELALPGSAGQLRLEPVTPGGLASARLPGELHIRFRVGGERLRLAGHVHRSHLKNLLQEARVLPWWRDRIPLLYAGRQLVAVADLWVSEEFAARAGEAGVRVVWQSPPEIYEQVSRRIV